MRRRWGSRFDLVLGSLRFVRHLVPRGGSGFFASRPRFLLPAFPLVRTARARPWHAAAVAGALTGLSFAYGA